jgi:5-methylcytosine-specific restriction endonuclease McrA
MWADGAADFAKRHGISWKEARRFQCTAEHLIPLSDGGTSRQNNVVAACRYCNQHRHKLTPAPDPAIYRKRVERRVAKGCWHPRSLHYMKDATA